MEAKDGRAEALVSGVVDADKERAVDVREAA